jgi:AraC-like DNA-binding protein
MIPSTPSGRPREHIEVTGAPDLPGVALVIMDQSSHLWNLYHETFTFTTGLDMACRARYRGVTHPAPRAFLGCFEPGDVHRIERWDNGLHTARGLLVPPATVRRIAEESGIPTETLHVADPITDHTRIYQAFRRLHVSLETAAPSLERQSRFEGCVRLVLEQGLEHPRQAREVRPERQAVRRVREILEDRFAENIQLEELASETGLSKYSLLRAFTREVGVPPHHFLIHVRLARARGLLRRGSPLASVAAATGFSDQSHLTRLFRRSFGVTPARFAAAFRGGAAE